MRILLTILIIINLVLPSWTLEESCNFGKLNGCRCYEKNWTFGDEEKIFCCCFGEHVTSIPQNFSNDVQVIIMKHVGLEKILTGDFKNYPKLTILDIYYAPKLVKLEAKAFETLEKLQKMSISNAPNLDTVQGSLIQNNPSLLALTIASSGLEKVPKLRMKKSQKALLKIDFSGNQITSVNHGAVRRIQTIQFDLRNNKLEKIEPFSFEKSKISKLRLRNNPTLKEIDENAFSKMATLQELDLSYTSITSLPTGGLADLSVLIIEGTKTLKQLPSIFTFTSLKEARLTYPYHCCFFKHAPRQAQAVKAKNLITNIEEIRLKYCVESTIAPSTTTHVPTTGKPLQAVDVLPPPSPRRHKRSSFSFSHGTWGSKVKSKTKSPGVSSAPPTLKPLFDGDTEWYHTPVPDEKIQSGPQVSTTVCQTGDVGFYQYYHNITCTPEPDALNPCEDVVGYTFLRFAIWIVWICAIFGNVAVIIVLSAVHHPRMRVHYFLMMNLAFADLCIGIYLALLATEDIKTMGEYFNYAVEWQTGVGCRIAGFLSVFASELSIVIMFLISFEIWYNTKYIFYGKRLTLRAAMIMTGAGWIYSLILAILPLVGVSSYSVTSTCLPLLIENIGDQIYLIFGLTVNIISFVGITINYVSIYITVNGSSSPSTRPEDVQVAKKMALLIGTDFLCWAPTIFFGLTAAVKAPLINITVAKIFLVLFYPINSFTNPFLYVFFTKMIRNDMTRVIRKHEWMQRLMPKSTGYGVIKEAKPEVKRDHYLHFYHSRPPGSGDSPRKNDRNIYVPVMQSVTQSTSLNSTPRNSTSNPRSLSVESVKSNPSTDQDIQLAVPGGSPLYLPTRKSISGLKNRFQNQLSDISEHSHSSNSNEDENHSRPQSVYDPLQKAITNLSTVPEEKKTTPPVKNKEKRHRSLNVDYSDLYRRESESSRSSGFSETSENRLGDESCHTLPLVRPHRIPIHEQMSFESGYNTSMSMNSTPELCSVNKHFFEMPMNDVKTTVEINNEGTVENQSWV